MASSRHVGVSLHLAVRERHCSFGSSKPRFLMLSSGMAGGKSDTHRLKAATEPAAEQVRNHPVSA